MDNQSKVSPALLSAVSRVLQLLPSNSNKLSWTKELHAYEYPDGHIGFNIEGSINNQTMIPSDFFTQFFNDVEKLVSYNDDEEKHYKEQCHDLSEENLSNHIFLTIERIKAQLKYLTDERNI